MKTFFLNTISLLYKSGSWLNLKLKSLNEKRYSDAFIISVDNLSFGGTGKTTLVMEIAQFLDSKGFSFGIVTRGYRSQFEKRGVRATPMHTAQEIGDEAKMMVTRFPNQAVYVGRNRENSILSALNDNIHILIFDDGFQSTHIYRDMKFLLVNPQQPYYYLRNFYGCTKWADYVLEYNQPGGYQFQLESFLDEMGQPVEIGEERVVAFSGLGDNQRFAESLEGINMVEFRGYSDHYAFSQTDLDQLDQLRKSLKATYLVCTEKDFVKCASLNLEGIPLIYIRNSIKLEFDYLKKILDNVEKKGVEILG